jgi:GH3 auxin-responsive promoter
MRHLIKLFAKLLAPIAKEFLQALANPQYTQLLLQQEIFQRLLNSEYGQSLGVTSIRDWNQIPIVNYDDIKHWISSGKTTAELILFYEKTSGSRGPAKLIPYTASLRRCFNHMFCIWAHDLIQYGPAFSTGKIYFCISPKLVDQENAALADDAEYLDNWLRLVLRPFLISVPGLNRIRDAQGFKQQLCLTLLQAEDLEIISIWSPSFLKVHLDYIQSHRQQLLEKLGGRICAQRASLLLEEEIPWTKLWPQLKLISCWDSAQAKQQAQYLRSHFPGVMVQGKGLLATEAPITLPLILAQGCVPLLDRVFFEFEDEQNQIHLLHELRQGITYSLIISQLGGLYRYRIGDRVRVSHFYFNTPCLEFLGRDRTTSDLVGEKLQEDFVANILLKLDLEGAFFQSLVPVTHPQPYYLLLLDRTKRLPHDIAQHLEIELMQSYHYRQARLLGQLAPAKILVSEKIPEIILEYTTQSGQRWGGLKHQQLVTTPLEENLLAQLSF